MLKLTDAGTLNPGDVAEKYWRVLSSAQRPDTFHRIAVANNLLLERPHDPALHHALEKIFLRPEYRELLARMQLDAAPHPVFPVAITRLGNLLTIKLLLMTDPFERFGILREPLWLARNAAAFVTRTLRAEWQKWFPADDGRNYIVGDLAVLSNEYTGSARIRANGITSPMDFLLEFIPRWEIDNRLDLAYSWSRMTMMLRHLQGTDATVVRLRTTLNIDARGLIFRGLSAEEFIAASFAVYTQVRRTSPTDQAKCLLDVKTLSSDMKMLPSLVRRFLHATAITHREYARQIGTRLGSATELRAYMSSDAATTDVIPLRDRPILRVSRNKFLVMDSQLVAELVASQMYWMIFNALTGQRRERFRELWGRLFELYLTELLAHYYPPASQILQADVRYNAGQIDALLDFGEIVIVFEFKASLLRSDTKFTRDPVHFEADVKRKFVENERGSPKAVRQLATSSMAIADGQVHTVITPPRRIFPVLVADEAAFQAPGMNEYLNRLFRPLLTSDADRIRPLTVMTVEEFEEALPHMEHNDTSWQALFEQRFTGEDVALESVHQILYSFQQHNNMPQRRNDFILAEFERVWNSMIQTYRTEV
ncbi:MAG TPA: hypothetical protein VFV49_06005 [Thermoanaerobaculia bacterium]|nr:hypothetical protein [Thermoanaerobaculia bacterium]